MKRLLLSAAALALAAPAWAGPNAGGVLAVDALPDVIYSDVGGSLCEAVGDDLPDFCRDLDTNVPPGTESVSVWQILALFPDGSSPRLAGVVFGIDYDGSALTVINHEQCGDFELFTNDWPGPGSGANVVWFEAQTSPIVRIYSFAGYAYYADASFGFGPHPVGPSGFGDDDVPVNVDEIAAYGSLGFNNNPGSAPCFDDAPGACCLSDGSCEVTFQADCESIGGQWQGPGTSCEDPGCEPFGACCLPDGSCAELEESACLDLSGVLFIGKECSPELCEPVPVIEASWGQIKRNHR